MVQKVLDLSNISVGLKDPLLHTRIAYYLEQPLSGLCADPKTPFPRAKFAELRDSLAYDIALLIRVNIFEHERETQAGAIFSNDAEACRGFVGLSSPEGADPVYPTINACTDVGDDIVRYYDSPVPPKYDKTQREFDKKALFSAHRLAHDPESATFALSVYLWYLFLYEQREIRYVNANGSSLTSSISLVPSTRIFSAQNSLIDSKVILPEDLEYLELSGTHVDATIRLPKKLRGYAAARTATDSSLVVPSSVRDLDLYDCPADDSLVLPAHLESFCAPRNFKGRISFPSSLKRLSIRGCPSFPFSSYVWPASLEELELFEYCLDGNHNSFPPLKYIHLDPRHHHQIQVLPETVREDYRRSQESLQYRIRHNKVAFVQLDVKVAEFEYNRFFISDFGYIPSPSQRPSLEDLLSRLFPNTNDDVLEAVAKQGFLAGKEVMNTTSKVVDDSYTGVVFSTGIDGKRVYCKVSSDKHLVEREAQYLTDAWLHPLLRPITPRMLGVFEVSGAAGLLTYGTENKGIVAEEDLQAYRTLRRKIFFAYRQQEHPEINFRNPVLVDVFNRALAHTILFSHQENPLYRVHKSPLIVPFETLIDRASVTKDALFLDLQGLRETYEIAARRYKEELPLVLGETLVHFDARPENIFPSAYRGLRPLGDPAFARVGFPEYDLARLESGKDEAYVSPYLFFREKIAQEVGANHGDFIFNPTIVVPFQERVRALSFLFATRTLSSKLSRDVLDQATYYRDLAFGLKGSYLK